MRKPSAADLLDACDAGVEVSVSARAVRLLATVRPEPEERLARMPVGWIAARLLELRSALIGPRLDALANCARCNALVEAPVDVERLLALAPPGQLPVDGRILEAGSEEYHVSFRPLACGDLATLDARGSAAERLMASLVVRAERVGVAIAASDLPADVRAALERRLLEDDPLASVELSLACPACRARWTEPLHVFDFVWAEIAAYGERLTREVARLAWAFGWSEAAILAMSPERRQRYLEVLPS